VHRLHCLRYSVVEGVLVPDEVVRRKDDEARAWVLPHDVRVAAQEADRRPFVLRLDHDVGGGERRQLLLPPRPVLLGHHDRDPVARHHPRRPIDGTPEE
jgi:hypothetical protein